MKKITISSLISILFVIIISCNNPTPICIDICHGNVIAIDNSSLEKLDGFTLAELNTDKIIKFKTIGDVGITVSHIKEHMLIAEPVSVPSTLIQKVNIWQQLLLICYRQRRH